MHGETLKLRIECGLMDVINRNVKEQISLCVGVMRVNTIIECKLILAVSLQLIVIDRT